MGNKKKLPLVFGLFGALVTVVTGCGNNTDKGAVELAIEKASKMTEAELVEAAKAEIGSNKLMVQSQTSGTAKAMAAFKEKYGIDYDADFVGSTKKDYQLYTALDVVASGKYYADMVMIQDARSLSQYMSEGILLNYVPSDIKLAEEDTKPLASVYFNKLFLYNKENTDFTIENVWQLAGSNSDAKHISKLSFQSPATENINMNFLLMMTSPDGIARLTKAYKDYYGVDYVDTNEYTNIGYKYIAEFLKNVSTYHSSDTTAIKETLPNDSQEERTVFYGAFAKYKDLIKNLGNDAERAAAILGWEHEMSGFKGFLYKMYTVIPATAKYPYASSLFIRYMLTQEGFDAGWADQYGYYSANSEISIMEGDKPLSYWKETCLVENGSYLSTVKNSAVSFIQANINK